MPLRFGRKSWKRHARAWRSARSSVHLELCSGHSECRAWRKCVRGCKSFLSFAEALFVTRRDLMAPFAPARMLVTATDLSEPHGSADPNSSWDNRVVRIICCRPCHGNQLQNWLPFRLSRPYKKIVRRLHVAPVNHNLFSGYNYKLRCSVAANDRDFVSGPLLVSSLSLRDECDRIIRVIIREHRP